MRPNMPSRRIEVTEPWGVRLVLAVDEVKRGIEKLFVHSLHALCGQRPRIFDLSVC